MPPASTQQTSSISVVTSGRMVFGFVNIGFVLSILGGLQALVVIFDLVLVCLLGITVSHSNPNGSDPVLGSFTFVMFLFMVSFWCLMTSGLMFFAQIFSLVASSLLPRTIFFSIYHLFSTVFFVASSISALGKASKYTAGIIDSSGKNIRGIVNASAGIGLLVTVLYGLLFLAGIFYYRRARASNT